MLISFSFAGNLCIGNEVSKPEIITSGMNKTNLDYENLKSWQNGDFLYLLDCQTNKIHIKNMISNETKIIDSLLDFKVHKLFVSGNKILFIEERPVVHAPKELKLNIAVAELSSNGNYRIIKKKQKTLLGDLLCKEFGEENILGFNRWGAGGYISDNKFYVPYTIAADKNVQVNANQTRQTPGTTYYGFLVFDAETLEMSSVVLGNASDIRLFSVATTQTHPIAALRRLEGTLQFTKSDVGHWSKPIQVANPMMPFRSGTEFAFDVEQENVYFVWSETSNKQPLGPKSIFFRSIDFTLNGVE